jgi:hypothetical protein
VPYGYPNYPLNTYGVNLGGSFKGFAVNVQFYGQYNITQNVSLQLFAFDSPTVYESQLNDTWMPEYENENPTMRSLNFKKASANGNYTDFDASFLRLKSAEISYTFQLQALKNAGISNLRVYTNGNNLFLWSHMPIDVEGQGYNLKNYPVTKMVNFGMSITF